MIEALNLGLTSTPAAAPAAASSGFDLTQVLTAVGFSAPLFLWLLKTHRDLVQIVIPRGFRLVRHEMRRHEKLAQDRHAEHIALLHLFEKSLPADKKPKGSKKTRRPKPRGSPAANSRVRRTKKKGNRPRT